MQHVEEFTTLNTFQWYDEYSSTLNNNWFDFTQQTSTTAVNPTC